MINRTKQRQQRRAKNALTLKQFVKTAWEAEMGEAKRRGTYVQNAEVENADYSRNPDGRRVLGTSLLLTAIMGGIQIRP